MLVGIFKGDSNTGRTSKSVQGHQISQSIQESSSVASEMVWHWFGRCVEGSKPLAGLSVREALIYFIGRFFRTFQKFPDVFNCFWELPLGLSQRTLSNFSCCERRVSSVVVDWTSHSPCAPVEASPSEKNKKELPLGLS